MENTAKKKIDIFYILRIFLSYWLLIGISCFIFLAIAAVYLKYSSKTYSVSAKVLINTERMQTRSTNTYVNVNDLMNQEKNLSDEVNILQSTPLIKDVINDMNLFTSYYSKADKLPMRMSFGLNNIYKNNPFIVIVDKNKVQPLNTLFYIKILDQNSFVIYAEKEETSLYLPEKERVLDERRKFYISGTYKFGDVVKNGLCSFKVLLNSNYSNEAHKGSDLYFQFKSPQGLAYKFQESLTVKSNFFQSSIAQLTFEGENLKLSLEFLERLINKYMEDNLEKKNYNARNTIDYIEEQLANISGDLGQTERQLQSFRNRREVMNIDDKFKNLVQQIEELEISRDELRVQMQNMNRLMHYFEENKDAKTFIAPSFTGMSDETLTTLIQELTELSRERQNLISTNQLKNPRIKTLDANIASILKVITDNVSFSLSTTINDLNEVNKKLEALNQEYERLPQTQRQLLSLERQFNINDEVYTALLNRRIQAKLIQASNLPDVEIVEPVHYDLVTSPNIKKVGIIFLFLGLLFPSIYIVLVNFVSPQVRTKEELENYCTLTSIGDIPHNEKAKVSNVINDNPNSPIVERFHFLRSNINYQLLGSTNKLVLVTSSIPNEGKSFISKNLAMSFASANFKTLLIAFDLRKNSSVHRELIPDQMVGLDSYLINEANVEDIISHTQYANLDFISNNQLPPNPATLISSPKVKELLDVVKSYYDYVIIDTPPFGIVSDAFLLMQYSDINLYVARLGVVAKKALKQSMNELSNKDIKNTYLVKNDVTKVEKSSYYAKYSYGETKERKIFGFLRSAKAS